MPTCKKCHCSFPNKIEYQGKELFLHKRSYCINCSPPGSKYGYNLRTQKRLEKLITGSYKICKCCQKTYPDSKNNECSTCRSVYVRSKQKQKAINLLGGKCVKCGDVKHHLLVFHHIDPESKTFTLSYAWGSKKWGLIENEIKKCVLLCHHCHIDIHQKDHSKIIEYFQAKESIC